MRKLLVLVLVLAFASAASAYSVWFEIDPEDVQECHYTASTIIKINVVSDMEIGSFALNIQSNFGTATKAGPYNPAFDPPEGMFPSNGEIVNEGGVLITGASGTILTYAYDPLPAYEIIYSFEFHVPYGLDPSTYIIIDDYTDTSAQPPIYTAIADPYWMYYIEDVEPAVIHVIPEPMTILLLGLGGLFLRRRK
jgi:hypothetical protein